MDAAIQTDNNLTGPSAITIQVVSARGPFAVDTATLAIRPTSVRFTSAAASALTIASATLDPIQRKASGLAADSDLEVSATPQTLAPGESTTIKLTGHMTAAPGVYLSTLRITFADGTQCARPVEIRVAAHSAWGFACMIMGLLMIGLLNALDSESGVQGQLQQALQARQAAHELLEGMPSPLGPPGLVDDLNREFDTAIAILQRPRDLSFFDRRGADAQDHLTAAKDLIAKLRTALSDKSRGDTDVAALTQTWAALSEAFDRLSKDFPVSPSPGDSLAARLNAFDGWATQRLLRSSIDYFSAAFSYDLTQVRLLYAAGRDADAAALSVAVRRWMQRAADVVHARATLLASFRQSSVNNLVTVQRIRQRLDAQDITPQRRAMIGRNLDETSALLSPPYVWSTRGLVNRRIQEARTETYRAEQEADLAAVRAAAAQEEAEDSIASIQAIIDQGAKLKRDANGKIVVAEKFAWLRRAADVWRIRLATLPEPNPPALRTALDALNSAIESRNIDDISARTRDLFEQWRIYSTARAQRMILKATAPFCMRMRENALIDAEATEQTLRTLAGHPKLQVWESKLDALRMKIDAAPETPARMPLNCLEAIGELSTSVYNLSNEVASAVWDTTVLSGSTKREVADQLSGALTPETLLNLLGNVRPLHIEVTTPRNDLYAQREIRFKLSNLDPAWGAGVNVGVDFGDGQSVTETAEDLHKNSGFAHTYAAPRSYALHVVATEADRDAKAALQDAAIGEGVLRQILIAPSPVSAASRLSDVFLNARFAIALIIAALLYFWRNQAQTQAFGAASLDYAQAFALGFAVSLAVSKLPEVVAGFFR